MTTYLADYFICMPEPVDDDNAKPIRLPWYLYYVTCLLEHDRRKGRPLTEAEAWDSEIAASRWRLLATQQAKGSYVDIVSPEDRAQMKEEAGRGVTFVND